MFASTPTEIEFNENGSIKQSEPDLSVRINYDIEELKKAGIRTEENVDNLVKNAHYFHGVFGDNIGGCFNLAKKFNMTAQEMFNLLITHGPYIVGLDRAFTFLDYNLRTRDNFMKLIRVIQFVNEIVKEFGNPIRYVDRNYGGFEFNYITSQKKFDEIIEKKLMKMKMPFLSGQLPELKNSTRIFFFNQKENKINRLHPLANKPILQAVFKYI